MSNPYAEENFGQPKAPKKKKNVLFWVLISVGVGFGILCCGGGTGLVMMGMNMIAADIEVQLRDNEQLRAEVGEIQSLEVNWSKTMNADDEDVMVFPLQGSEGSGELTVNSVTGDNANEEIRSATLRTSDGREIELNL